MNNPEISSLLNKDYETSSKLPCWEFCRKVFELLEKKIPGHVSQLKKIDAPVIGSVVLMKQGDNWHAGVVWPDILHFIHVRKPLNKIEQNFRARKDRLNDPLYEPLIDGYYDYDKE